MDGGESEKSLSRAASTKKEGGCRDNRSADPAILHRKKGSGCRYVRGQRRRVEPGSELESAGAKTNGAERRYVTREQLERDEAGAWVGRKRGPGQQGSKKHEP